MWVYDVHVVVGLYSLLQVFVHAAMLQNLSSLLALQCMHRGFVGR